MVSATAVHIGLRKCILCAAVTFTMLNSAHKEYSSSYIFDDKDV